MLDMSEKTNTAINYDKARQEILTKKAKLAGVISLSKEVSAPTRPLSDEPFISAEDMADVPPEAGGIRVTDTRTHLEAVPTPEELVEPAAAEVASAPRASDLEPPKAA